MRVIIIIPTYNEKDNILKLIDEIRILREHIVKNNNIYVDLLIIDDSSPDGTGEIVEELKRDCFVRLRRTRNDINLEVIHREKNWDWG